MSTTTNHTEAHDPSLLATSTGAQLTDVHASFMQGVADARAFRLAAQVRNANALAALVRTAGEGR